MRLIDTDELREKIAGNQSLYCPCCGQRIDWEDEEDGEMRQK